VVGGLDGRGGAFRLNWRRNLACGGMNVTVDLAAGDRPTTGNDVIAGTPLGQTIDGSGGNDRICGGAGNDRLIGGNGNDKLFGDDGGDQLEGGPGFDAMNGGRQRDGCAGGLGRDTATACELVSGVP
jgi:Ca2+-binding RTX toxin-like protein